MKWDLKSIFLGPFKRPLDFQYGKKTSCDKMMTWSHVFKLQGFVKKDMMRKRD
jgi:hypothetical protein